MTTPDTPDAPAEHDASEVDTPQAAPRRRRFGCLSQFLLGTIIVLGGLFAAIYFADPLGRVQDMLFGDGEPEISVADTTLLAIRETTELRAATGTFSVPVKVEEDKGRFGAILPDFLDGDSAVAIYQGTVDAHVDLSALTDENLVIDETNNTLTVTLPAPVLSDPNIDESKSMVVAQGRGILTRFQDFFAETPLADKQILDEAGSAAIAEAAQQSELRANAQANATDFVESLGRSLGFDEVTVHFEAP